ncbi:MAG: hypothetical protein HDS14_00560 [Bacteroides sp.]|nr:hypothetical protein [Bacteroides sp.]
MAKTVSHESLMTAKLKETASVEPMGYYPLITDTSGNIQKTDSLIPNPQAPLVTDADNAPCGWSRTNNSTANLPASGLGGFLLTLRYDTKAAIQFFCQWGASTPALYSRKRFSGSGTEGWGIWQKFAFVS